MLRGANAEPFAKQKLSLILVSVLFTNWLAPLAQGASRHEPSASRRASPHARASHSSQMPIDTGQGQADFIRQIPLTTNDIIYDKHSQMLYASVPSGAGGGGNSLTEINPVSGSMGRSVFIGSEPGKLAISDNGQYLYVYLQGAVAIRRFDIAARTSGLQFTVNDPQYNYAYTVTDMAVVPGQPESLAVSAGIVAIYDNDVRRPTIAGSSSPFSPYIKFSASGDTLYGIPSVGVPSNLQKFAVTSGGVTSTSTVQVSGGGDFRFEGGRLYLPTGHVLDANSGNLLGTFPDVGPGALVVPDSTVGRVYFLTNGIPGGNGTLTLKAYDMNTFVPLGSLSISGVSGTPTSLVRWGANGLAFRTGNNPSSSNPSPNADQLYLIQTSLIPSSEPVPTPTPTPSPTPPPTPSPTPAVSIRQVALPSNEIIFDPNRQMLYASVPSIAGTIGNSVTAVNPMTATIGASVFIGSEPRKLALTGDGHYLYVSLDGANAVRRFDLTTRMAGLQFSIGGDTFNGPYYVASLAAIPGHPEAVAVARHGPQYIYEGVAVYDDGVQRPKTTANTSAETDSVVSGDSDTTLYGIGNNDGRPQVFTIDASGVTLTKTIIVHGRPNDIRFAAGLIFTTTGGVIDPGSGTIKGTFAGVGEAALVAPDPANGRVFFLTPITQSGQAVLRAYDLNTFLPVGSLTIPNLIGSPTSLVRWGANGLAFRTTGSTTGYNSPTAADGQLFLIQTSLVNDPVPVPTATPSPTPIPSPSPFPLATEVDQIQLATNDLVSDPSGGKLYASVPGRAGINGNSITTIDPAVGAVGASVFIGSEPNRLALSDNGQYLYAGLDGAGAVRRFDLATQTPGLQFSLATGQGTGLAMAFDLAVLPGQPQSVAVTRLGGVAVYDNDVQRPNVASSPDGLSYIKFSASADMLYSYGRVNSTINVEKIAITSQGATLVSRIPAGGGGDFRIANGRIYMPTGDVVNTQSGMLVGKFSGIGFGSLVAPDPVNGRVYFLSGQDYFAGGPATLTLKAYDINTFLLIGSVQIPGVGGPPGSLVRWGANGLAFRTGVSLYGGPNTPKGNQVMLIRTALVPSSETIPTKVTFSSPAYSVNEADGRATITVYRSGENSAPATVDYATSDGTASQRNKYITSTGTLSFAPGEIMKTFSIPIINEAYPEGNQTINLTLSNPTGATLGAASTAVLTIIDDDTAPPSSNPIDQPQYFVRQHYLDFLSREPDQGGLNYWIGQIFQCESNESCLLSRRIGVSAAYFTSAEFQETGYFVYRFYKAALGRQPGYAEFMPDRSRVVGGIDLEASKTSYANLFVERAAFAAQYPSALTPGQYVDALNGNTGGSLTQAERDALVSGLMNQTETRASVLRKVVDNQAFQRKEYNAAFVLMQYFGYLRRDPDAEGYNFWLKIMNGLDKSAFQGMTCAFITSFEYQDRFSPVRTHSNADCGNAR